MDPSDILLTTAEIAVAFAGFASVAAVFQHGGPEGWSPAVVVRLHAMVEGSLSTLAYALLPIVLHHLRLFETGEWRVAAGCLALGLGAYTVRILRRSAPVLVRGDLSLRFARATLGITVLAVALELLNAAGAFPGRAQGVYIVGVVWSLAFSGLMFLRVALSGPARVLRS